MPETTSKSSSPENMDYFENLVSKFATKDDIESLTTLLKQQSMEIKSLKSELRRLDDKVTLLENEVTFLKNHNDLREQRCDDMDQYGRRECHETTDECKKKIIDYFSSLKVQVNDCDIDR